MKCYTADPRSKQKNNLSKGKIAELFLSTTFSFFSTAARTRDGTASRANDELHTYGLDDPNSCPQSSYRSSIIYDYPPGNLAGLGEEACWWDGDEECTAKEGLFCRHLNSFEGVVRCATFSSQYSRILTKVPRAGNRRDSPAVPGALTQAFKAVRINIFPLVNAGSSPIRQVAVEN
jgi:hypothetical protein